MKKKLHKLVEKGKVNYVNNEEYDKENIEEFDDEGDKNKVNMITLE